MTGRICAAIASLLCCFCLIAPARADDTLAPFAGHPWFSFSTTAMAYSDELLIKGDTLIMWKSKLRLRYAGDIQPATGHPLWGGRPVYRLYEILQPRLYEFRNHNRFCGSPGDTSVVLPRYIALTIEKDDPGNTLVMVVFSDRPQATTFYKQAFCGSYSYTDK